MNEPFQFVSSEMLRSENCLESRGEINGMSSAAADSDSDLVGRRPTFGALSVKATAVRSKVESRSGSFDSDCTGGGSDANVDRVRKVALDDGGGSGGANDGRCGD